MDKDADTARLEKEVMKRGKAVFNGWHETVSQAYGHLVLSPAQMIKRRIQESLKEHGNTEAIAEQMMLWNNANIESLGNAFLHKYGHMIWPSLERFHHQQRSERIEYIRLWELHRLSEEWRPDILTVYPLYSQLELFEHKYGSEAYEKGDKFSIEHLKRMLLKTNNAEAFILDRGGCQALEKYRHLIPTESDKFEHEYMEGGEDGQLRAKKIFKIRGTKIFDEGWSPSIKEKYIQYAPTDLEQSEAINTIEVIEHDLMLFGERIFDGWDNEVREKWGQLCPTEEARFEYNYTEKVEGVLKANEKLKLEEELAFEGYRPEIKDRYSHLLGRSTRL